MYALVKLVRFVSVPVLFTIFIGIFNSCVPGLDNESSLTDEKVQNYIRVYKKLREKAPEILQGLNEGGNSVENGKVGFTSFEEIIKEGGLEDYPDFVRLNAKIGAIFSILQANKGMDTFEKLNTDSKAMLDENIKLLEEQLTNPDIPEETKQEIKQTIQELKNGKTELSENWKKNEKIAKLVLKSVQKITKLIVSEEDIEVVIRHEDEIMEAYIGFPMPTLE